MKVEKLMAAWSGALVGKKPPLVGLQLSGVPGGESFICQERWGRKGWEQGSN